MKLEFLDGSQIDVIAIFGGPRMINGKIRDTLRIEVSPESSNLEDLKIYFQDPLKTSILYSYTEETGLHQMELNKNIIGEGYNIFVSADQETRKIPQPPGVLAPDQTETINVIVISQMTYQEYQDAKLPNRG